MKLSALVIATTIAGSSAFAPVSRTVVSRDVTLSMAENKVPFFASQDASEAADPAPPTKTVEDQIEELTQTEVKKMQRASNLRNAQGVDYAPWMKISEDDEAKIRQVMKERTDARVKRQEQEKTVSGALLMDSQAQELSGGGLRSKIIDGDVELQWATSSEANTKGFQVKRRPARTEEYEVLASFEDWGPLASKGPEGGAYSYLDTSVTPGGWVYRVTECEMDGNENDICQALVDVETQEEQRGAIFAAVGFVGLMAAALVAGVALDPVGGF